MAKQGLVSVEKFGTPVCAGLELHDVQLSETSIASVGVPSVWHEAEALMARKIESATGLRDGVEVVISLLNGRSEPRFLGLGAGSCSFALEWILPRLDDPRACTLECIDPTPHLIDAAGERAERLGIRFAGTATDVDNLELELETYDVILCWTSLHHFVELDWIAAQLSRGLKREGTLVTTDICSRNGFLLWPESRQVVNELWELLPASYRVAHTLSPEPVPCDLYPEIDCSKSGPEFSRSESILPTLERHLDRRYLIFAHSLLRRFFDTMFGPNFDLRRPFDRSFFNLVQDYDEMALETGRLRPETFFGVYQKGPNPPGPVRSLDEIFSTR